MNKKKRRDHLSTKYYKVIIDYNSYKKIEPLERIYQTRMGLRKYWRLQIGWADLFLDKFWEQHKLPCSFKILKNIIYRIPVEAILSHLMVTVPILTVNQYFSVKLKKNPLRIMM